MIETEIKALESIGKRDHSLTNEYRLFGPPGTGKTRSVTSHAYRSVQRFGSNSVMATSFTRAAAVELAGRDVPIDLDRIGTLHSICFRALGSPRLAEANVQEWNRENLGFPITPVSRGRWLEGDDSLTGEDSTLRAGDRMLQHLNCFRGRMLPPGSWPAVVKNFSVRWSRYKTANGLLDFTDLIETALRDLQFAPYKPAVIIADEAQDLGLILLALLKKWGRHADHFLLAGDDDQAIYTWAGVSPEAMLNPKLPADHNVFLTKSQRVPRAIHGLAESLIRQVSQRKEKVYEPRDVTGEVKRPSHGYKSPEYSILRTLERHLSEGKRIMVLGTCSFMLRPILAVLRREVIPFHNPYRKSNGFWNPIRANCHRSAANRVKALLVAHPAFGTRDHRWRAGELSLWTEWLPDQGLLTEQGREVITGLGPTKDVTNEIFEAVFQQHAIAAILAALHASSPIALLDWWRNHIASTFRKRVQFPADIAARQGGDALVDPPRVIVGTIHSVKGGEADIVYLFPDLSRAGEAQYRQRGAPRDSVIRQFYVGVTRTRETLYLCSPESGAAISI
jgi:DNA helicase-2/ATP-dependent DNA helicase PcrA